MTLHPLHSSTHLRTRHHADSALEYHPERAVAQSKREPLSVAHALGHCTCAYHCHCSPATRLLRKGRCRQSWHAAHWAHRHGPSSNLDPRTVRTGKPHPSRPVAAIASLFSSGRHHAGTGTDEPQHVRCRQVGVALFVERQVALREPGQATPLAGKRGCASCSAGSFSSPELTRSYPQMCSAFASSLVVILPLERPPREFKVGNTCVSRCVALGSPYRCVDF